MVTKLLKEKSADPSFDSLELETNINTIVYKLYDLTEEEIKIIETT